MGQILGTMGGLWWGEMRKNGLNLKVPWEVCGGMRWERMGQYGRVTYYRRGREVSQVHIITFEALKNAPPPISVSAKDYTQNPGTHLFVCHYNYPWTLAKHVKLIQLHTNAGSHSADKLQQFMVLGLQPRLLIRRCASVCLGFVGARISSSLILAAIPSQSIARPGGRRLRHMDA
jgi:hypothetical protein